MKKYFTFNLTKIFCTTAISDLYKHTNTHKQTEKMSQVETATQLKDHITAVTESLSQLRSNFQNSITTNSINTPDSIQRANVNNPIEEIPKLSSLLSAHTTKLGLIFKPPISKTTYNACKIEIDSLIKYSILLLSLLYQIQKDKNIYSSLFANELSYEGLSIIEVNLILLNNLNELVDIEEEVTTTTTTTTTTDQRLSSVGLVWDACEKLSKTCKNGSSGVLRSKLKLTNKLVVDALDELKEWLENPIVGGGFDFDDNDIFGLNNKDENLKSNEEEDEKADESVIEFGKIWSTKIQMIKLLISLLDKSIPASKYTVKYSKGLDLFNDSCLKINEHVDDIVACTVYDADVKNGESAGKLLNKEAIQVLELVRKINNNDEKKCKWLDSWKIKYEECYTI